MTLTVLLMLAGIAATNLSPAQRQTGASVDEKTAAAAVRTGSFLETVRLSTHGPQPGKASVGQLTNRRTGVTCTLLIAPVKPLVDPGSVVPTHDHHADGIVRNDLSPCVE
jgi:hypothetical protein